jgi:hypothetical protein
MRWRQCSALAGAFGTSLAAGNKKLQTRHNRQAVIAPALPEAVDG